MKQKDKDTYEDRIQCETLDEVDRLLVNVSYMKSRKRYYLSVYPAGNSKAGSEYEVIHVTQGDTLWLGDPVARFNATTFSQVALGCQQSIESRSGITWEFITKLALREGLKIKGWDDQDVADLKAISSAPICANPDTVERFEGSIAAAHEALCQPVNTRADFLTAMEDLKFFLGGSQRAFVMQLARGEERQFFFGKMVELANLVAGMPATYDQDGAGDDAIAYLHYFAGGCDWYITEKDKSSDDDEPKGVQHQAFGLADLGYGAELGYISIQELLDNNVELDFHWSPKSVADIKGRPNSFDNSTGVVTDPAPLHGVSAAV